MSKCDISIKLDRNKWTDRVRPGKNDPKNQTYVITPGESFGVGIEFTPATDVHVNAITFEIHGEEECTSGSGSNATTHRHELFKEKVYLAEDTPYSAGQLNQFVAQIPVPDLPAYAFAASDNEVNWKLKAQVDIPKWPDWVEEYELRMVPAQVTE